MLVEPIGEEVEIFVQCRPAVTQAGAIDEFGGDVRFLELLDHDLSLLNRHHFVGIAMNDERRRGA